MRTCLRLLILAVVVAICFPMLAVDGQEKVADPKAADPKAAVGAKAADKVKVADKAKVNQDDAKKDDEAKKDDAKKPEKKVDKAEKKPKLNYGAVFVGKITQLDANSQRQFTVQISSKVPIPNQQAANTYAQQQQQQAQRYAQIMSARESPAQRAQQLYQLEMQMAQSAAQFQAQMYTYKDVTQDVLLKAADDVRVRIPAPPPDYDDKGNLKKYTNKELLAMRGTEGLPGYPAEFDALRSGQIVQVYLKQQAQTTVYAKKGPKTGGPAGGLGGIKLKDDDAEIGGAPRHEAVMVVIISEPQQQQ